jgi:hypothetical protein
MPKTSLPCAVVVSMMPLVSDLTRTPRLRGRRLQGFHHGEFVAVMQRHKLRLRLSRIDLLEKNMRAVPLDQPHTDGLAGARHADRVQEGQERLRIRSGLRTARG